MIHTVVRFSQEAQSRRNTHTLNGDGFISLGELNLHAHTQPYWAHIIRVEAAKVYQQVNVESSGAATAVIRLPSCNTLPSLHRQYKSCLPFLLLYYASGGRIMRAGAQRGTFYDYVRVVEGLGSCVRLARELQWPI